MNKLEQIKEIEYRVAENIIALKKLDGTYLKYCCPEGYKGGTSYNDYDTIHGSRKEYTVEKYLHEKLKLQTMIDLDESILKNLKSEVDTDNYLKLLKDNKQKVKFLRIVKRCTQAEVAEILHISTRQVQRIEKSLNVM